MRVKPYNIGHNYCRAIATPGSGNGILSRFKAFDEVRAIYLNPFKILISFHYFVH